MEKLKELYKGEHPPGSTMKPLHFLLDTCVSILEGVWDHIGGGANIYGALVVSQEQVEHCIHTISTFFYSLFLGDSHSIIVPDQGTSSSASTWKHVTRTWTRTWKASEVIGLG